MLEHLLRRAVARHYRSRLAGLDLRPLQQKFDDGLIVSTGDAVGASALLEQIGPIPVLSALLERLEPDGLGEGPGRGRHRRRRPSSSPSRACT